MDPHLLFVEPDAPAASALAGRLRAAGFVVDIASDGASGVARALAAPYACVVTELDTGAVGGFELCRRLRAEPRTEHVPIVVLAARGDEIDRVVAFEVGADDYVTKPCSPRELVLRIRARLRRPGAPPAAPVALRAGGLEVDPVRFRASLDGRALPLTTTELALLAALARRAGAVVTRASLLQEVWELPSGRESRTLDTHLRRLREKLGPAGDRVQTIRGVGYRLVDDAEGGGSHPG